ncbi:MAG: chemotaxis protein CheX [Gemmataceae bacterium]|nr:chemotaxis protein CheX [Gemmata sp.]MDW8198635.1 chemotaxis protein CheX [Gemmataceae bacterium]
MAPLLTPTAAPFPAVISTAARDATTEFFQSFCGLQSQELTLATHDPPEGEIMSTISFVGDVAWAFSMIFPATAAVALAKAFAGFEIPADSADLGDLVGEVVNVIAGGICARLDRHGLRAQMSLPTVVRGANLSLLVPSGAATTRMAFTSPDGVFWVQLVKAPITAGPPGQTNT